MGEIDHDTADLEYFALPRSPRSDGQRRPVVSTCSPFGRTSRQRAGNSINSQVRAPYRRQSTLLVLLTRSHFRRWLPPPRYFRYTSKTTLLQFRRLFNSITARRPAAEALVFRKSDSAVRWCCDEFITGAAGACEQINHL